MSIQQQPDVLSLSMNLKPIIVQSTAETVTFTLKKNGEVLLSQSYQTDKNGQVQIDLRQMVHESLQTIVSDVGIVYTQADLVADFSALIDMDTVNFRVVRGGVDRLADSATNFLTQNFLTWQPNVKPVTYYSPEFLTYYAVVAGTVKLRAYFTDESGTVKSQTDYTVTELMPGIAYTMPLQYSVVAGWLGHKLPAYYDVWVENTSGQRLTYIQRYYAEDMRSEQEQWVLFENSLGGIDTFRAYGVTTLNGEHTHNIAETDECFQEYRVDTERKFQKNTGYLNDNERKWLLDFFPSQNKYLYAGNYLRQIVVMESNVSFTDRDIPSNYTFTFKYADARPLLNLPRTDLPADILNITVPEVGSFTVPPRLAEFSRLPLSEGALFPIQNPYSEEWSTTNVAAIGYYLADFLSRIFGSGGGVGHKHRNYDLLELLSYIEGYLLVNGQKIKAGYADKAGSVEGMEDMFLHKDRADGTPFPITFGDWVKFGEFITGISGGCIDKNGILEMEEGIFRKRLFVPEIAYNRVTYFKGRMCASPGGGCTVKEWTDNGDGSYTITPDLTDADGLSQFVDDILTTYFVTKNAEGKLQGFEEMKFRVTSADYTAKTFVMTPKPGTDWKPGDAMVLAQTGNFTDEDRQTYILIDTVGGNNCITFFDHANTWDVEPAQEMSWIGKKKGRTVHGIPADNYSAVFRHVIMSGKIFQVDDITGEAFRVPLFKGTWKKGEKYAYYDEVTHNGSSWICVNEKGTSTEPADGNADWLKYAAKGESGKGIKSTDVEYAISVSNVIAPVDGWQTTSPEWEAGKYIWSRTKIVYSDGEIKYTQAACISGGQGADGKGIKSITEEYYLSSSSATTTGGEWQTDSPAWKNGWYIWTRTRIVFTDGTFTVTNAICVTGSKGADGTSITNCGDWQTGKHIPYMGITKMAGRVFLCVAPDGTDNPPMWTQTTNEGRRILQTQNGGKSYGYIITEEVNTDEWEQLTSDGGMVYLISTCSNIRVSSAGSLVPSAFRVYAKRTLGSATLTYPDGYLAARGYSNGIWSAIAGPSRASEITVNASAGYSTFSVRCYQSQADASAWNDSFIAEISVGVSYDGASGRDASEPRPRGFFAKGNTYVWNEDYHDIVLATFNNRTIPFRVRAYGTSVTVAPTSIDGDANWEAAQQFMFVAMDMALIRKIRADEILVDDLVVQNVLARDKNGNVTCNIDGETGEVNVQGKITATAAFIKIHGFSSNEGYFYLNPNFGSDFGNGRPSRIGQSEYMLPSSAQCVGMKISLIIYNNSSGSTYGYVSVVTSDGFNDMELVDGQYHYCNKAHITEPGVYEFISLGGVWISTNKNGISYSYADLGDHDYENPVN